MVQVAPEDASSNPFADFVATSSRNSSYLPRSSIRAGRPGETDKVEAAPLRVWPGGKPVTTVAVVTSALKTKYVTIIWRRFKQFPLCSHQVELLNTIRHHRRGDVAGDCNFLGVLPICIIRNLLL